MGVLFDCVVEGVPRTRKSTGQARTEWKERVNRAILDRWASEEPPVSDRLAAIVVYFYRDQTDLDVDAIGKYILDQLQGIVVEDDRLFDQVTFRKTDQSQLELLDDPPMVLADWFRKVSNFVYVAVTPSPEHRRLPQ